MGKLREKTLWVSADEVDHKEFAENNASLLPIEPGTERFENWNRFPNTGNMLALKELALQLANIANDVDETVPDPKPAPGVLFAMGGHVIKTGCGPIIADLANRGFINAFLVNGSWLLHDIEMALYGRTSEDVTGTIASGRYGFTAETASVYGNALHRAHHEKRPFFHCLGDMIRDQIGEHANERSVIAHLTGPDQIGDNIHVFTAHALGTDTVHCHPNLDWGILGTVAQREFDMHLEYFVAMMNGGAWVNIGSAVVLPERFLKTLASATNLAVNHNSGPEFTRLNTVAVLDMLRPYRAYTSVLERGRECGARCAFGIQGPHEMTLPLLREALLCVNSTVNGDEDAPAVFPNWEVDW